MRTPSALALVWVGLLMIAGGCSDQNAPVTAAHPEGWAATHPRDAQLGLESCARCHGPALKGGGDAVSCFSCHFDGPPFHIHPANWGDARQDHQGFAAQNLSWTACANAVCHGTALRGGKAAGTPTGPSCFSASLTRPDGGSSSCHTSGPPAPHAVPYASPALHGPEARGRQLYCRNCHGRPTNDFDGGLVSDAAILNRPNGRCAQCHPAAKAHPTNWQGTNDPDPPYLATHRAAGPQAIQEGCSLCHNTTAPGAGLMRGAPSCLSASFTNADGNSSGCHTAGPGRLPHALPYANPNLHGPAAKTQLDFCQNCHGTPGTTKFDGGFATTACSSCHPAAGAHPGRWQGTNQEDASYVATHRTVSTADAQRTCGICHAVTGTGASPNPAAPSCFSSSFRNRAGDATGCHASGPGNAPFHPAGWEFDHVVVTRVSTGSCLAECHQDVTGAPNGIPGCASCHLGGATTASRIFHPDGSPIAADFGRFPGDALVPHQGYVALTLSGDATSCALAYCHGTDLKGGSRPRNGSWPDGWSCFLAACHGAQPKRWLIP